MTRRTALHVAASLPDPKPAVALVKLLCKHGANPKPKDSAGITPAFCAAAAASKATLAALHPDGMTLGMTVGIRQEP